jgi:hypothetical protein
MALWRFGNGPGTHALVIGVGEYPWLVGGSQPTFAQHEGMGQLTSAPISALRFGEWLATSYASRTHPLRSLRVLVSAPGQGEWAPKPGLETKIPSRARFDTLKSALLAWHAELTAADRALFFFSGHGIAAGDQQTLLCEDYGEYPAAALGSAFDFTAFRIAMLGAPAREQFYFVDACRVSSGKLMRSLNHYGSPIVDPSAAIPSPPRLRPTLYATVPGASAFGRPGKTSLFTEALLQAMRGAGAQQTVDGWAIRPGVLAAGVEHLLARLARGYGSFQGCLGDGSASVSLHDVANPEVPVSIHCRAPIDAAQAKVIVAGPASREQGPPVPMPLDLDLPVGDYSFTATPNGGPAKRLYVLPPCVEVALP